MSALHIVTTAIAPAATQSLSSAEESAETPFTALLGEQMQAHAQLPAQLLPQAAEKQDTDTTEAEEFEAPELTAADAQALTAALPVEARQDALPARLFPERGTETLRTDVTARDGRNDRTGPRGPAAATSVPLAGDAAPETAGTTSRVAPAFELPAAQAIETPNPTGAAQAPVTTPAIERPAVATPVHTLQQPVGSARWAGELGQTVQILIRSEQQSATLHVTPADLGPIEVRIDMSGDQANLSFTVQHPDTRNVLENALSRLRDMLAEGGIALGDAHVNQQSGEQREAAAEPAHRNGGGNALAPDTAAETIAVRARVGLVDTFA